MDSLLSALTRLAQLQAEPLDRLALHEAVEEARHLTDAPLAQVNAMARLLRVRAPRWLKAPDPAAIPALLHQTGRGWGLLRGLNAQGQWIVERFDSERHGWAEEAQAGLEGALIGRITLRRPYAAGNSKVLRLIRDELLSHRRALAEAALGGILINLMVLATSLYSMQIYDRVVPTGAVQTLWVLTLGVFAAVLFEYFTKRARSGIFERLVDQVDQRLSRLVFMRLLAIRMDQLPPSVGALAAQLRGYETVRGFLTAASIYLMVDMPFGLVFVVLIGLIGGGYLALIPGLFFCLSAAIGLHYRGRVESYALQATAAGNLKTGLLVETVEGAETIKSGGGGWRMLSRWMQTTDEARTYELQMRELSEHSQYLTALFRQHSYVSLVAAGALSVSRGEITMGSLIACSILSSHALAPAAMIPGQLVQWAHAKAALQGLDRIWALQDDHHGIERPIAPESIHGDYRFETVVSQYGGGPEALAVNGLEIRAGEKLGVLGPVGAGKTTLLRLLSGMYKPQQGRVLLDGMDIAQLAKPVLADYIGYLQQDGRLFAGTLRDNLILGMLDPGDSVILEAAATTGLMAAVIAAHPKGLMQEIAEGGTGLSGGQRQLVNLTRLMLRRPRIWLLDEPTASMDRPLEAVVTAALKRALSAEDTLVLVPQAGDAGAGGPPAGHRQPAGAAGWPEDAGAGAVAAAVRRQRRMTPQPPRRLSMTGLLALGLAVFIAWAAFFEIDQIVRAQGQVIASSRSQIIQAVDGGVLAELKVHEGQSVQAGELLAVLEKNRAEAGYRESRDKVAAIQAALAQARAEVGGEPPAFGRELDSWPGLVAARQALYQQRKQALDEELASLDRALRLAHEELAMSEALFKTGDVSRYDVMRAQRQVVDLEGQRAARRNKYLQEAQGEKARLEEELATHRNQLSERGSVLEHTDLTAPVAGIVSSLKVTTIGGVLRPGDELMQIAPSGDSLVVEGKVSPADIGLLRVGLPASVKLDAFDYTLYGVLRGELSHISPDTLTEPGPAGREQTYYRVYVRIAGGGFQGKRAQEVTVMPGMTASLDIRTGSRTVFSYLVKPVVKTFGEALSER